MSSAFDDISFDQRNLTIGPYLARTRIAYFSMEIAIRPEIHTYSGGLGVLAGDTARSGADLELPMVFVTLLSRKGYLRQEFDETGWQVERPHPWHPETFATPLRAKVAIPIADREVWVRPWLHVLASALGHPVPVLMLDTDLEENHPDDRGITDHLYGGDSEYRLRQEIVLGIAGLRLLSALGFANISTYHMNEGHAALLALDLMRRHPRPVDLLDDCGPRFDVSPVREMCIFTTHTPVEAGHDRFPYDLVHRLLGHYIDIGQIKLLAGEHEMNMTHLALNLSGYVNGVAQRHAETTKRMFPGYRIRAVTNGVHLPTWAHWTFRDLYSKHFPSWGHEPEILVQADQIPDDAVWNAHMTAKRELVDFVHKKTGVFMNADKPIIGYARRMTSYKRPELLFTDIEALRRINARRPFQIVLSGKAHPHDEPGKRHIQAIHRHIAELKDEIPIAFIPDYDLNVAKSLVPGVDVWLNTPVPPMEASGTSGMKAALNGCLNLSVLDGWWDEAYEEGLGWAIGRGEQYDNHEMADDIESRALYDLLEHQVLPMFYDRDDQGVPRTWVQWMKKCISVLAPRFNTNCMVQEYAQQYYLPALHRARTLEADNLKPSVELAHQKLRLRQHWSALAVSDVRTSVASHLLVHQPLVIDVDVMLGELRPDEVHVQAYAGRTDGSGHLHEGQTYELTHQQDLGNGRHHYTGQIKAINSGSHGFAIRIIPGGGLMEGVTEPGLIYWESPKAPPPEKKKPARKKAEASP